jgi:hypothetical protein
VPGSPPPPPVPFLGTLPRRFRAALAPGEALERLNLALSAAGLEGGVDRTNAWVRPPGGGPPAPPVLRLSVEPSDLGCVVTARFDPSRYEGFDLWALAFTVLFGLMTISLWLGGGLPPGLRRLLTLVFPVILAGLVATVAARFAIATRHRRARERALALVISAMEIDAE